MYNVCTMYTTAVGVILARQLACFRYVFCSLRSHGTRDKAGSIIDRCYRERLAWKCLCGNVLLAALARHTLRLWALTRPSAQPTVPGQGKIATCVER